MLENCLGLIAESIMDPTFDGPSFPEGFGWVTNKKQDGTSYFLHLVKETLKSETIEYVEKMNVWR